MKTQIFLFHAEWCKVCPHMEAIFTELQKEMQGEELVFINIDVENDEGVDASCKYQVRNVPTILIMKRGRIVERIAGTRTKQELKDIIEKWK